MAAVDGDQATWKGDMVSLCRLNFAYLVCAHLKRTDRNMALLGNPPHEEKLTPDDSNRSTEEIAFQEEEALSVM